MTTDSRITPGDKVLIESMLKYVETKARYEQLMVQVQELPPDERSSLLERITLDEKDVKLPQSIADLFATNSQAGDFTGTTARLEHAVHTVNDALTSYHRQRDQALYNEGIDTLTGLTRNEKLFDRFVTIYVREAFSSLETGLRSIIGITHLDLDDFTQGNTIYNHQQMNLVLANTGAIIKGIIKRDLEGAVRSGGEEFITFSVSQLQDGAEKVAEKLRDGIGRATYKLTIDNAPQEYKQTVSGGYVNLHLDNGIIQEILRVYRSFKERIEAESNGRSKELKKERDEQIAKLLRPIFEESIGNADDACYESKLMGKNRVTRFDPLKKSAGFYTHVRELYKQVKLNQISSEAAQESARSYLTKRGF